MIGVLRLGHRVARDARITTHVFLVARAFGADWGILSGERDDSILRVISRVVKRWGGDFKIEYQRNWRKFLRGRKEEGWEIIHLTMYGLPIQEKIEEIRRSRKNKLIVVGGRKVPPEIYQIANYNLSITSQPHSEVAALAIFLHELFRGRELKKKFKGKIRIIPMESGKKVKLE
jgi:tRNA (cytidine56-2'-O)-methyltransferase